MAFLIPSGICRAYRKARRFGLAAKQTDATVTLLETALCMSWHEWAGIVAWTWIVTA